ncbi:DNA primase [Neolewinella xylanilytica]|uniref:DNA primase n=1 Tax=Neolewinella xylanilytica TaxID=1514080 RepID=A0A2S6I5E4_9BACT|nr:DNA primase [Neolewinella xylanilytica]PPK86388.1 DNA primase [Neolewinella xylanilytica]
MITEDSVREVIDTARIEDIVGDFVNLRRRGNNYSGLCPFHNEKTPSFNVNPARNIYKCFGCGVGGDPVKFLMELEQLPFPDAIRWIARKYNIKLEEKEVSQEVREELQEKESLIITNDFARTFYADQLFHTEEGKSIGLSYFRSRGFRRETLAAFDLGYASADSDTLLRAARAAGHKDEQLEKLGLVRNGRDFFRDRVMFTIHNLAGKPIAFAGRILKKDAKAPKYINSPESEIYHKSDVLYGMFQARQAVRKADRIYMVEGYTDVISLHQNGVKNVVATSGTSLTDGQASLVKRFTDNVTLLYDGDKAGVKAALRGVDVLLTSDLNVRVVLLPDGHDPDSYLQAVGTTAFSEYLEAASKDFLYFKADLLLEEAGDDVARRTTAIRDIGATLALVEDPLKRAGYLQQFSGRLGIEESLLVNLVNTAIADRRAQGRKDREREERKVQRERRASGKPGLDPPRAADDGWEGLVEPGWATAESGEVEEAPPTAMPAAPEASSQLAVGHEFQEKYLLQLLVRDGHKLYDEATETSIATYFTGNVADLLNDFDKPVYRELLQTVIAYLQEVGRAPDPTWYTEHADSRWRQIAIDAVATPYTYSPNWREKYGLRLSQKMPEENHRLTAEIFLRIFRMEKIERKCRDNAGLIARYEKDGNFSKLKTHLKVQMKLDEMRRDLARELGTVVLSR